MPRPVTREEERRLIWQRTLEAALNHHGRSKTYGMQKVIAADAGLGEAAVSKWAKNLSRPEPHIIRRLADLYGVSAAWLGGDESSADYGEFGPPDALLRQAADITEMVVIELMPDAGGKDFIAVMKRSHELLLEGKSEDEAFAQLFREVRQKKKDSE